MPFDASAEEIIRLLDLRPHPEGGHYRETFRDAAETDGRAASTAIYFLLAANEFSHWHRIDAVEVWHWYAGAPLSLSISLDGHRTTEFLLGSEISNGQHPQVIVPARVWQAAKSLGAWTLVGCTVAPGFAFDGFELAPPEWAPS
jgi:predicted cupin superfamily sugar epimerase